MEDRMMKFYSKESNMLALHAMHGHFATSHSHINYYVDVTSIKTRVAEAKQAAHVLYSRIPKTKYVDTIVCMDGTEVVGTFLTEEIQRDGIMGTTNQHETVYVISPEINSNNQMLFRDNNKAAINGKHVVLLLATTTTGETIRRALECIQYYGGEIEWVASLFGTINSVDGVEVETLFDESDVPDMPHIRLQTVRSAGRDKRLRRWLTVLDIQNCNFWGHCLQQCPLSLFRQETM